MNALLFQQAVLGWYDQHGRTDLPWQKNQTPYRVWVSEIMLQQTQVATVIPYYKRFIAQYPSLKSLSNASMDDVLALWTGLGYYTRCRNLYKTAQQITSEHQGRFPRDLQALTNLPGIGRSTAGAILSLSMEQSATILDGNVKRVLGRFFAEPDWPGQAKVADRMWLKAEKLTPEKRCNHYTQAMMDLGATLCTRSKPGCGICPLMLHCQAYKSGEPTSFPGKKPKKKTPEKHTQLLIVRNHKNEVLLNQRPPSGLWGGLWTFPDCDIDSTLATQQGTLGLHCNANEQWPSFKHTFSHYRLHITPVLLSSKGKALKGSQSIKESSAQWFAIDDALKLGLPAPIKKLLQKL